MSSLKEKLDFLAKGQDFLTEALDDYIMGSFLGQKPQRPGHLEMVAIHNKRVADWNAMVLRSTTGAIGALAAAPRGGPKRWH